MMVVIESIKKTSLIGIAINEAAKANDAVVIITSNSQHSCSPPPDLLDFPPLSPLPTSIYYPHNHIHSNSNHMTFMLQILQLYKRIVYRNGFGKIVRDILDYVRNYLNIKLPLLIVKFKQY
jgi:hypothetical protein